jgi:hypothetical protein
MIFHPLLFLHVKEGDTVKVALKTVAHGVRAHEKYPHG